MLFCAIETNAQIKDDLEREYYWRLNDSARIATDMEFKDPAHSPLPAEEVVGFDHLSYFDFNADYVVAARFEATPDEKPFLMPTTTDRLPKYVKHGHLFFELNGQSLRLSVYRNIDLSKRAGYENYFFVPFNDSTNGFETYGGGRYLDIYGPLEDTVILDFNRVYNPYCAYNSKYSCPIPPVENRLAVRIEAGVLKWKEH